MSDATTLSGGFADPAQDSARAFRACLQAMARPGRIQQTTGTMPPAPLSPAAGAVLLTLVDATTPVFIGASHDTPAVRQWIAFHCGAPIVAQADAAFALGTWDALQPVDAFAIGTAEYPDRSVTLIVECPSLDAPNARLAGPGVETTQDARLPHIAAFQANATLFPLGFDCFFTAGHGLTGLPRSTKVEAI